MEQGQEVLIRLLAGDAELTGWGIGVFSNGLEKLCTTQAGDMTICFIVEPDSTQTGPEFHKNLAVTANLDDREFVLSGSFTGQLDGQLNEVRTMHTATFSSGSTAGLLQFTQTSIDAISVEAGQRVIITVIISFS